MLAQRPIVHCLWLSAESILNLVVVMERGQSNKVVMAIVRAGLCPPEPVRISVTDRSAWSDTRPATKAAVDMVADVMPFDQTKRAHALTNPSIRMAILIRPRRRQAHI